MLKLGQGLDEAAIQTLADANELTINRLFLSKHRDDSMMLLMSDRKGSRPRIRMQITLDGNPRREFLDEAGKVIASLPEEKNKR